MLGDPVNPNGEEDELDDGPDDGPAVAGGMPLDGADGADGDDETDGFREMLGSRVKPNGEEDRPDDGAAVSTDGADVTVGC